jgi:peptidyl-prolyl cis-trans isomerase SurA
MDDAMPTKTAALHALFRFLACTAIAALVLAATTPGATAQGIAAFVNGDPITNFDVEQRSKLIELSTRKAPPRKEVLDELIDEKLKLQLLKRFNIPDIDKDVENAFTNMARRMRASPKQFTEQLARSGLRTDTLKSRIRAELIWSQVVRGRYQASFQFNERDIMARLENRKTDDSVSATSYDYSLRPILFIVPRGSPAAVIDARRKEAEALRSRFTNCQEGLVLARGMRDVAVRTAVTRSSADLQPALRAILEKTEVGRLTAPEVTLQGIEVYALCGKKPSASEDLIGKREAREQLFKERFDARSKEYLKELRSQAMIEYR